MCSDIILKPSDHLSFLEEIKTCLLFKLACWLAVQLFIALISEA
jgi:hypothetical protein